MPADFPNTPTIGQEFSLDGRTWTWSGTTWDAVLAEPPSFEASDTAPPYPQIGDAWFDTSTGQFFIYYDSGWVEFGTNLTGPAGEDGVASATLPLSYNPETRAISIDLSAYYTSSEVDQEITAAIAALIDSAPSTLDTLNELAAALSDDADFAATVANQLGTIETDIDNAELSITNLQASLLTKKTQTSLEISSDITLSPNVRYYVDTSAVRTLTLPSAPAVDDEIWIIDQTNNAETNNITVNNGGSLINGTSDILNINVNGAIAVLLYTGSSLGWRI